MITNLQMTLVVVTLVAIGVLLLWRSAGDLTPQWAAVSAQLGGLLVATGLLGVVWELVGRRSLAREIQELAGLSKEVVDAGLVALPRRFYEDTPWADLFRDAQEVDVVVSYAGQQCHALGQDLGLLRPGRLCDVAEPSRFHARVSHRWVGQVLRSGDGGGSHLAH